MAGEDVIQWINTVQFYEAEAFRQVIARHGLKVHPRAQERIGLVYIGSPAHQLGPGVPWFNARQTNDDAESPVFEIAIGGPGQGVHRRWSQSEDATGAALDSWLESLRFVPANAVRDQRLAVEELIAALAGLRNDHLRIAGELERSKREIVNLEAEKQLAQDALRALIDMGHALMVSPDPKPKSGGAWAAAVGWFLNEMFGGVVGNRTDAAVTWMAERVEFAEFAELINLVIEQAGNLPL